jgi:hypothetical protein
MGPDYHDLQKNAMTERSSWSLAGLLELCPKVDRIAGARFSMPNPMSKIL